MTIGSEVGMHLRIEWIAQAVLVSNSKHLIAHRWGDRIGWAAEEADVVVGLRYALSSLRSS